jgi:hypothetical protein
VVVNEKDLAKQLSKPPAVVANALSVLAEILEAEGLISNTGLARYDYAKILS